MEKTERKERDVGQRFGDSSATYDKAATVQRSAALRLAAEASRWIPHGASVLEIGCGTGTLTAAIARACKPKRMVINDLSDKMLSAAISRTRRFAPDTGVTPLEADAETTEWPAADVIVSASAAQWFASPLRFVSKAARALPRGGTVALVTYGPQTFKELRGGESNSYPTLEEWGAEFRKNGFDIKLASKTFETQHFASRTSMLRMMAMSGIGTRLPGQSTANLGGASELTWEVLSLVAVLKPRL